MPLVLSTELQWYLDNHLSHQIHTSERKAFRACRRRWNWVYRDMYSPNVTAEPLEFGVAFHVAMETFYEPRTWLADLEIRTNLALVAFRRTCEAHLKKYKKLNADPDVTILESYKTRIDLGLKMIRYYCEQMTPHYDRRWTPVRVEVSFEVPLKHPDNNEQLWCKCDRCWNRFVKSDAGQKIIRENIELQRSNNSGCPCAETGDQESWRENHWRGLPVTYGGRLDALFQDEQGRYWIADWKQQPLDSNIVTPNGWTRMGELKVGDYVIGSNGKPTKVIGVYPKGIHEVYEVVFRDGTIVECSKDHVWAVKSTQFGKRSVIEAQDIMNRPSYENYAVELPSGPVEFENDNRLPMHPYILGSLLGDGCFTGNTLTFASQSGETVELLKKYATSDVTITDQRHHGANKWQITGPWKSQLRELNLWTCSSGSKFIPHIYLEASVEDRILLLQGLCDTDGNTGMYRFTTTSSIMAECFRELIWSLGGNCSLNVSQERLHQNGTTINVPQYGLNYWLPDTIEPNQLERKRIGRNRRTKAMHRGIKEVRATGVMKEMQCIRVEADDHLYMTNNFILTHNTTIRLLDEDAEASFLQLDDQVVSYLWALHQYGINCAGFVYVEIKKTFPAPPEMLTRKYKGKIYSTSKTNLTTYELARKTFIEGDNDAWQMGLYDEYLQWLQMDGPKFTQRHQIHKNSNEIINAGYAIATEAMDMIDNPRVYPQPGRFSCNWCLFKQPCLGANMGEDYIYTLSTLFEKKTLLYWEEKAASTD